MEKERILYKLVREVSLDTFRQIVVENLISYLPTKYQHLSLKLCTTEKINGAKTGIQFVPMDRSQTSSHAVGMVFYLEEIYLLFIKAEDTIEEALRYIAYQCSNMLDEPYPESITKGVMAHHDEDYVRRNVICQLVNAAANENMLKNSPHRRFHEFAIVYRVFLEESTPPQCMSYIVNYNQAFHLGLTEEQLYWYAMINTRNMADICSLSEIMAEMGIEFKVTDGPQLFFVGNRMRMHGASTILIEDKLYELANKLNSDLYLIPSSIHEMLALPVYDYSPEYVAELIMEVNTAQVVPEERLSNSVYLYSLEKRQVCIAHEVATSIITS